jgi:hypothetical protein
MILCGSGSEFGKVSVSVPDNRYATGISFFTKNFVQNLAFSMLDAALFSQKVGLPFLNF